jgi:type IV pilus assembly protein PilX
MALLMSVIFLLILALLGVWAASTNVLEERMAGGSRNRDLALQAAEAALEHAENTIGGWRAGPFDGSVTGLLPYLATEANDVSYWRNDARWTSAASVPAGNLSQVNQMPKYVIQKLPNTANPSNPSLINVENYRITARAVGKDASAVVILQSIVAYTP